LEPVGSVVRESGGIQIMVEIGDEFFEGDLHSCVFTRSLRS
jgi:hypothetical protein